MCGGVGAWAGDRLLTLRAREDDYGDRGDDGNDCQQRPHDPSRMRLLRRLRGRREFFLSGRGFNGGELCVCTFEPLLERCGAPEGAVRLEIFATSV
jgi:hypothetical protein